MNIFIFKNFYPERVEGEPKPTPQYFLSAWRLRQELPYCGTNPEEIRGRGRKAVFSAEQSSQLGSFSSPQIDFDSWVGILW